MSAGTHRGNGIDRVQDGKEQHTVDAPGVIRVSGAGDLLAGRIIKMKEGGLRGENQV